MDYKIRLKRMEFRAYHGCYDMEQIVGNRFAVDLEITTELGDLAQSDDVTRAVNYLSVYEIVRDVMGRKCRTIEAVAAAIIEAVRAAYPAIKSVECEVAKLSPPLGGKLDSVSVILVG